MNNILTYSKCFSNQNFNSFDLDMYAKILERDTHTTSAKK